MHFKKLEARFPQRSVNYFIHKLQIFIHFFDTHFMNTDFSYCIPRSVQRYSACLTETTSLSAEKTGASGCSSGVEHNLAKVGVEGSNPFARSSFSDWSGIKIPASSGIFAFRNLDYRNIKLSTVPHILRWKQYKYNELRLQTAQH